MSWRLLSVVPFDQCLYCSLCPLASPSLSLAPSSTPPPSVLSGVTETDPSGTAYPGHTGAALWIISLCGAKTRRWGARGERLSFLVFSSFLHNRKLLFPPVLCSFVPPNGEHSWIPRLLFWLWEATLTPIDFGLKQKRRKKYSALPALWCPNKCFCFFCQDTPNCESCGNPILQSQAAHLIF